MMSRMSDSGIVMVRADSGQWFPEARCCRCLERVGPEGRMIWNAGPEQTVVTPMAVCGDACEAATRGQVPELTLQTMGVAHFWFFLMGGTGSTEAVGELVDSAALGRFITENRQGGSDGPGQ
jgi:hypothetical protein